MIGIFLCLALLFPASSRASVESRELEEIGSAVLLEGANDYLSASEDLGRGWEPVAASRGEAALERMREGREILRRARVGDVGELAELREEEVADLDEELEDLAVRTGLSQEVLKEKLGESTPERFLEILGIRLAGDEAAPLQELLGGSAAGAPLSGT